MMVMVFSPVSSSSSTGTDAMGCESSATLIRPGVYRGGSERERYDPAIAISPQPRPTEADPATGALRFPFALDPFQADAIDAVEQGHSVLLSAPTGAGKTVVAEAAIARALRQGKSVLYTSPIKALSNQKFRDFGQLFGPERVGIMTGDVTENEDAPILVMTTEIFHNMLVVRDLSRIASVSCLIFDEFHYLADRDRGRVWEEAVILCPKDIQVVCLSATMTNIDELASWIGDVFGEVKVIVDKTRPVPLRYHYYTLGELHRALRPDGRPNRKLMELEMYDSYRDVGVDDAGWERRRRRGPVTGAVEVVEALLEKDMAPALYFLFSRKDTERAAIDVSGALPDLAPLVAARIQEAVDQCLRRLPSDMQGLSQTARLTGCLRAGVAFHHAGVLPELKELVEELFGRGLIRVLFATETFALGVNMPARTVVLARITKFDGEQHRQLTAREFHQMAGRAGRRGKDVLGHVVIVSDPWMPFEGVGQLITAPAEPVDSAFAVTYNSYLNLIDSYGPNSAEEIVQRSFLMHQLSGQGERLRRRLDAVRSEIAAVRAKFRASTPQCYFGYRGNPLRQYESMLLDRARIGHEEKELSKRNKKLSRRQWDPVLQRRIHSARDRERYLEGEAARLDLELRKSPCAPCTRLEEHRKDSQRLAQLEREQDHLTHRLAQLDRQLQARQGRELEVIEATLEALGYIGDGRDEAKAHLLGGIFDESALQLSELIDRGELDRLEPGELAEVISWYASADRQRATHDRRTRQRHDISGRLRSVRSAVLELGEEIQALEEEWGDPETELVRPLYSNLIRQWCDGVPFGSLCDEYEADEGDIASHIAKTANLLRQLEKATATSSSYEVVNRKVIAARACVEGRLAR
ncbi:MAG TPA: DEAD/DEAH box helicase [Chloroflexota bacterium]|nr:DEAD/DEAH box helicase [Chloroflexota bacterium]